MAYDPVTGLAVVFDGTRMWTYDVDSGTWTDVDEGAPDPFEPTQAWSSGSLAYDPSADRFVLVVFAHASTVGSTWEFDLRSGAWAHEDAAAGNLAVGRLTRSDFLVYDELNERMLAFGTRGVAAYDRAAAAWHILEGAGSYDWHWAAKAYDPLNDRVVAIQLDAGFAPTDDPRSYRMIRQSPPTAFDVRTGAWFALVDWGP